MVPWWSKQLSGGGEFENVGWRRVGLWIFFNIFLHMFNKDGVKNRDVTIFNCEIDFSRRCSCFLGGFVTLTYTWHGPTKEAPKWCKVQNRYVLPFQKGWFSGSILVFRGSTRKWGWSSSHVFLEKLHMADWIWRSEVVKIGDFGSIIYIYLHTY